MGPIADRPARSYRRVLSWFRDDFFRRLFLNAGKLLTANGVAGLIGLATTLLTARALGPESYGILALVLAYELVVAGLVTFNAWQAIIKFGSEALERDDRQGLRQLVKFGFGLDLGSAIAGVALAMSLAGSITRLLGWDESVCPLLRLYSILILFSLSGTPVGILRLFNRFDLLGYAAMLSAGLRLAGVLWCLMAGRDLRSFVLVYLVTGIAGQSWQVLVSLWVLRKQGLKNVLGAPIRGVWSKFPGIWDYVWTTNLNSTIRTLSREADELVIAGLTNPETLGVFKVAKQFSQVLPRLTDPLYQSIYPELSRLWAAERRNAFVSLMKRTTAIVGAVAAVGWLAFVLLGPWLIAWTVGPTYSPAYPVGVIYGFALLIGLWAFSLQPAMLAVGLPRRSFKAQVASTILYFSLLLPAVRFLGIAGASLAYVAYYGAWAVVMFCGLWPSLTARTGCVPPGDSL